MEKGFIAIGDRSHGPRRRLRARIGPQWYRLLGVGVGAVVGLNHALALESPGMVEVDALSRYVGLDFPGIGMRFRCAGRQPRRLVDRGTRRCVCRLINGTAEAPGVSRRGVRCRSLVRVAIPLPNVVPIVAPPIRGPHEAPARPPRLAPTRIAEGRRAGAGVVAVVLGGRRGVQVVRAWLQCKHGALKGLP